MNPHFWPNIILYYITLYYDNVYRMHSIKVSIQSHNATDHGGTHGVWCLCPSWQVLLKRIDILWWLIGSMQSTCCRKQTCARVTVLGLCVCLSVCPSVTALAASASAYTCSQRYSGVCLRLFLDKYVWVFEKTFRSKVIA